MSNFIKPDFRLNSLELRCENNEVCLYGTKEGLKKLANLILSIANDTKTTHIHLEDYDFLTPNSLAGAVAIFEKD